MKRVMLAALAGTAVVLAGTANAQQPDFSKVEIKTTDLGNKTYMLEGQGGNITVAVGSDGILMVDTQFSPLHDKIKAAVTKISPLPIKYVVNTHYHGDHVDGNAAFHKEGATIVAHDNLRVRLAAGTTNLFNGNKTPPAPADAIPTVTYQVGDMKLAVRRPHARTQARDQRPHRRRHLALFPGRQRAFARRHLQQRPLSQYRLEQWRRDRRHDPRPTSVISRRATRTPRSCPATGRSPPRQNLQEFLDMLIEARDRVKKLLRRGQERAGNARGRSAG